MGNPRRMAQIHKCCVRGSNSSSFVAWPLAVARSLLGRVQVSDVRGARGCARGSADETSRDKDLTVLKERSSRQGPRDRQRLGVRDWCECVIVRKI